VGQLPAGAPQLFVVVDTEEEFDWSAAYSRDNVSVTAIDEVGRLQAVLSPYGVKPTYVVDYPVASTASSADRLAGIALSGDCHIGAHLHPWVTPPFVEPLGPRTSYPCNLGLEVEREKIHLLKDAIVNNIGVTPRSFKAGRYGFGRTTAEVLESLEFDIDLSVNPHMDFTDDGGPSFEGFLPVPSFFGSRRRLLELPCTTGFVGTARRAGPWLHRAASAPWLTPFRTVGLLSRSGLLNKVMLSPEGNSLEEMQTLTDTLYRADGIRTFALTFHSPSLKPGCTSYVQTTAERDAFLTTIGRYCAFFMNTLGGVPTTPADLFDQMTQTKGDSI
jgi:hypothetical protein